MRGLNERYDARMIGDNELAKADEVYNRAGLIAPRPGYRELHADSLGIALKRIQYPGTLVGGIALHVASGTLYWSEPLTLLIRKIVLATGVVSTVRSAINTIKSLCVSTDGATLYFTRTTTGGSISSCASDGSGGITDLATGVGVVEDICTDGTNLYWVNLTSNTIRSSPISGFSEQQQISSANAGTLVAQSCVSVRSATGKLYWTNAAGDAKWADSSLASPNTNVAVFIDGASTGGSGVIVTGTPSRVFFAPTATTISQYNPTTGALTQAVLAAQSGLTLISRFAYNSTTSTLYFIDYNLAGSKSSIYAVNTSLDANYPVTTEWFRRELKGVAPASYFCKDIVWGQVIDTTDSTSELSVLFPSLGIQKSIQMGYIAGDGTDGDPTIWNTNSRTSDPTYFDPFSASSARIAFAWTGRGIDTAEGGWKLAQDGIAPRALNYVLSDTIVTFTFSNGTTGTWGFVVDGIGYQRNLPNTDPTAAEVRANILRATGSINGVVVSRSGSSPNYTFTIRVHGVWSGKNLPTGYISMHTTSGADMTIGTVTVSQSGGLDTDAYIYCRPCGIPTPVGDPSAASSGASIGWFGDQAAGTPALDGLYNYRVSYYSSRFNIESPATAPLGDGPAGSDYIDIDTGTSLIASIVLTTANIPSTMWFASTPFRHVDRVRLYRRRWGNALSGGVPDGVGMDDDWYLISETDIGIATTTITLTDDGDPTANLGIRLPAFNGYPPDDAKLVTIHKDRAFYTTADHNVWFSELPRQDSPGAIELGHEYVGNSTQNFIALDNFAEHDAGLTAAFSFASRLMVSDPKGETAIDSSLIDFGQVDTDNLRGSAAIANHWAVAETESMPDLQGYAAWVSPRGHIYFFDGSTTNRISQPLKASVDDMHKKFWNEDTYFESGLATLYYSTMVLWPDENCIILSTFDKSGTAYNLVYNVETQAWSKWTLGGWGWCLGRQWTGTNKGKDLLVFGKAGGKLYYLDETASDNGAAFTTDVRSKRFDLGSAAHKKDFKEIGVLVSKRDVGSGVPNLSLYPLLPAKGALTGAPSEDIDADEEMVISRVQAPARTLQIRVVHNVTASSTNRARDDGDIYGFAFEHGEERGMMREARDSAT